MMTPEFQMYLKNACKSALESSLLPGTNVTNWKFNFVSGEEVYKSGKAILLTISSHRFRILSALCFSNSTNLTDFVSDAIGTKDSESTSPDAVIDFLSEVMNTLCGQVKRDLQINVESLGMSTPCPLDSNSLRFVDELKLDDIFFLEAKYKNETLLYGCFYTSMYGEVLLSDSNTEDESDSGELELF